MPIVREEHSRSRSRRTSAWLTLALLIPVIALLPSCFFAYQFELPFRKTQVTLGRVELPIDGFPFWNSTGLLYDVEAREARRGYLITLKSWGYMVAWTYSAPSQPPNSTVVKVHYGW